MSSYTNTPSGTNTSTESTTTSTSTSPCVTQTEFSTKIYNTTKDLLSNFDDKHAKQDANFKETIAYQYEIFYEKFEEQLHTLSLQIKEDSTNFSLKLYDQENIISPFKTSYN